MRQRGNILVLGAPTVVALWFVFGFALMYVTTDPAQFGIYRPRQQWLFAHVLGGIAALLFGPTQFWLGLNRRTNTPHRVLGSLYVAAVVVSGSAAYYLAAHTDFGWVFGLGLGSMASVWMISTALATVAICLHRVEQHREWMIRSYVMTFGFVTFRILDSLWDMSKVGTILERKAAASWLSWIVPLLLTEWILQGRKIFARQISAVPPRDAKAYTAVPERAAFGLRNSESSYQHLR
jgi:uncharacterized membrane protein